MSSFFTALLCSLMRCETFFVSLSDVNCITILASYFTNHTRFHHGDVASFGLNSNFLRVVSSLKTVLYTNIGEDLFDRLRLTRMYWIVFLVIFSWSIMLAMDSFGTLGIIWFWYLLINFLNGLVLCLALIQEFYLLWQHDESCKKFDSDLVSGTWSNLLQNKGASTL